MFIQTLSVACRHQVFPAYMLWVRQITQWVYTMWLEKNWNDFWYLSVDRQPAHDRKIAIAGNQELLCGLIYSTCSYSTCKSLVIQHFPVLLLRIFPCIHRCLKAWSILLKRQQSLLMDLLRSRVNSSPMEIISTFLERRLGLSCTGSKYPLWFVSKNHRRLYPRTIRWS